MKMQKVEPLYGFWSFITVALQGAGGGGSGGDYLGVVSTVP